MELRNVLSNLESVDRQTLSDKVFESIKLLIVNNELPAGTRLTENDVAAQLEVSPTPVREAFKKLSAEGFVSVIPYKGVVVRKITEKELRDTYQCREALEVMALKLAFDKIVDDVDTLNDYVELSKHAKRPSEQFKINSMIHNFIIDKADNQKLKDMLEQINDIIYRDRETSLINMIRTEQINKEHENMVNAIRNRDLDKAIEAMTQHIRNGYKYITNKR